MKTPIWIRLLALPCALLLGPTVASAHRDACGIVSKAEVERVLGAKVKTVVSGDGFCTHVSSSSIVFAVALKEYDSKDAAAKAQAEDQPRWERDGKRIRVEPGLGERTLEAVGSRSIEYSVRKGKAVLNVALAGEDLDVLEAHHAKLLDLVRKTVDRL